MTSTTTANDVESDRPTRKPKAPPEATTPAGPARLPAQDAVVEDPAAALLALRRFHRGQRADDAVPVDPTVMPALLHPMRGASIARSDYPLYLAPATAAPTTDGPTVLPLRDLLRSALEGFAPEEQDAPILHDQLLGYERIVRKSVASGSYAVGARTIFVAAAETMKKTLALREKDAKRLEVELDSFLEALPDDGELLGFQPGASLPLLLHAARERRVARAAEFRGTIETILEKLGGLLEIERGKDASSHDSKSLEGSIGGAGAAWIDSTRLSGALGQHRGTQSMDPARRDRIRDIVATLEAYLGGEAPIEMVVIHGESVPAPPPEFGDVPASASPDPLGEAAARWREEADRFVPVVRAVRQAALEAEDLYEPERHGPWFEGLGRDVFSKDEVALLPVIVALDRATEAAGHLASFSAVLRTGTPIQVLLDGLPGTEAADSIENSLGGSRLELGYVGIGHREAFVQQSSAARPDHLMAGYRTALESARTSLHLLAGDPLVSGSGAPIGPWVETGAAVEGRAHPFFRYDPTAGATWASRMDFSGNPAADVDWPTGALPVLGADGAEETLDIPFTFADWALLFPGMAGHFREAPELGESEDLVPLAEFLAASSEDRMPRVPYIWGAAHDGRMMRLVVSDDLVGACRDRLGWWRTLQELAGVRNEYVIEATQKVRREMEATWAVERERIAAEHAEDIERVREETATEALGGLARALLDLDAGEALRGSTGTAAPSAGPAAPEAPPATAGEAAPAEAEAPAVEDDDELLEDTWVDTPLCTTCNDCTNLNPKLFVYDANKQVRIGDPTAGTFEQRVLAAEKCPARCIHPGAPQNPAEPNLEALIERALPFQ